MAGWLCALREHRGCAAFLGPLEIAVNVGEKDVVACFALHRL